MSQNSAHQAIREVKWTAETNPGRFRPNNEDAFLLVKFDLQELQYLGKVGDFPLDSNRFIFAVSDGIGGAQAGEYASQSALKSISKLISRKFHQGKKSIQINHQELLTAFCEEIHTAIIEISRYYQECRNMGATLSLGWVDGSRLHFAHLGDSRIYHIPAGQDIIQITEDHTVAARKVREGKLTPAEAKRDKSYHVLEKCIGSGKGFDQPQLGYLDLNAGDKLVFCTDGVTDGLSNYAIQKTVVTPPPYLQNMIPSERIVRESLDASGRDNITTIVVEFEA